MKFKTITFNLCKSSDPIPKHYPINPEYAKNISATSSSRRGMTILTNFWQSIPPKMQENMIHQIFTPKYLEEKKECRLTRSSGMVKPSPKCINNLCMDFLQDLVHKITIIDSMTGELYAEIHNNEETQNNKSIFDFLPQNVDFGNLEIKIDYTLETALDIFVNSWNAQYLDYLPQYFKLDEHTIQMIKIHTAIFLDELQKKREAQKEERRRKRDYRG